MTASSGFRRLGFVLLAVIAVATGVLTTAGYLISPDAVRTEVLDGIRSATGLDPILRGKATVSLFPKGSVSFADVVLGDADRPALTAERLTARLRFFPLLVGRVEIADVSLERPTIAVDIEAEGKSNWAALIDALARGMKPNATRAVAAFSEMRIDNGTIIFRNHVNKTIETLSDVDFSLAWPSISKSFGATGRFIWRNESVDASLTLADFPAALAGNRTGVKLRVAGAPMKAAFEGSISVRPTLKIEGTVAADAASLRSALVWTGQNPLPGGGFGRFAIKAQTNVVGGTIGLSGVNVELDGNSAEGVLTFATDGRQTLQGTLASDTLDLTPYVSTVRLLTTNQREWNSTRITPEGLSGIDFDLRLSAANVILSNAKLGRTAIGANLRGGHLAVTIGEAQAYGGVIKGSLALANFEAGIDLKSQMQFIDVDLEKCLGQLFGLHRLAGKGNITFNVEGTGESVLGVTRTLNGTAGLVGQNGALTGLNVEQLLRRLERRPLSGGGEFRTGSTPYDKITVGLKIAQGTVSVDDVKIEGSAVRLALAGTASIPERELDLKGTATLVSARQGASAFELPFIVQGSWDDPIMLPDPEALIRRSGAAAPLLNAVRERSARDAVRSAIERLTGNAPAAPAAPAAAAPAAEPPANGAAPAVQQ
ncbi:MAG: AsmA family protein [Pseudolabrys sp.]|nr:AsmA family protein [Pseudolabrys sp.]MDP2294462.1 AsmA family protein [Pseudolabrys sp.]